MRASASSLRVPPPAEHVPALDGLRGVAILLVIAFHYVTAAGYGEGSRATRLLIGAAGSLWTGVDLFFVLSGFLITGVLLRAKDGPAYFTSFYMRRVLRIFPLYYGALVVLFVVLPRLVPFDTPALQRIEATQGWLWAYSQNLAMTVHAEDYFNVEWLWIGHFWSLAVEEHFYLVWPLVVFVCSRRTLLGVAIGIVATTPLLRAAMLARHVYYGAVFTLTVCRVDELALGALVAILAQDPRGAARLPRLARAGFAIGGAYLVAVVVLRGRPLDYTHWTMLGPGFTAVSLVFASTLVRALAPGPNALARALAAPLLTRIGKYSYGAYVLHTPMQPVYLRLFPPHRIEGALRPLGAAASSVIALVGFAAIGAAITMLLAVVSYHAYEKHFLRLKRRFAYGAPPLAVAAKP